MKGSPYFGDEGSGSALWAVLSSASCKRVGNVFPRFLARLNIPAAARWLK